MDLVTLEQIRAAAAVVREYFPPTPILAAPSLSRRFGAEIWLKLETCTPIRTFKLRGALVRVRALLRAGAPGVCTASAGNHGLAVARAARLMGLPATVCVPAQANPQKVEAIAAEGARVVAAGRDYQEAFEHCQRISREQGLPIVHAYDDPEVIAGQGTLGLEIAAAGEWDAVLTGVGGGGLISGVATALKALRPQIRVFGVQSEGADAMVRSLETGRITPVEQVRTIADGLGARYPGERTFAHTRAYVDEVVRVTEADFWTAMGLLLAEERQVAEPAGSAGVAALVRHGAERFGRRILVLLTGANIAHTVLQRVAAGLAGQDRAE